MNHPLPAYSGRDPYIFVSYSHRDRDIVYGEIRLLQELGFNVWYDEGIDAGDDWTDTLANALAGSFNCVFFITPRSVESENCRREINFAQHLQTPVTSVHLVETELPSGLQLTLGHRQAILKHELPTERYRQKLENALLSAATGVEATEYRPSSQPAPKLSEAKDGRHSVLVLPFVNRSRNEEADFFCEGIADEIITALSSVSSLRVISGSAARQIDARSASLRDLQQLLGVSYVLEGSVQSAGNRLRITVKLPQTETGEVLWANRWDGANDDIFDIQDSISLGVLDALKVELGEAQSARIVAHPIPDVSAYEYFLRARQSVHQWTDVALRQALDYLQRGEDIIGENAYIISARGYIYWQFHNLGLDPDPKHLEAAQSCIDTLFEMDPQSPDGHRLQGLVNVMRKDSMVSAVNHLKKALAGNPNDNDALFWLSQVFGLVGRVSSGMVLAERLLKLDPITPLNHGLPAVLAMMDGDAKKAVSLFGECSRNDPGNPIFGYLYGQSLAMNGQVDEAAAAFRTVSSQRPDGFFGSLATFYESCLQGDAERADDAASAGFLGASRSDPQTSWTVAQGYALLGRDDDATDWIENAVSLGFWNYPLLAERDVLLSRLKEHERYQSLMLDLREKWISFDA